MKTVEELLEKKNEIILQKAVIHHGKEEVLHALQQVAVELGERYKGMNRKMVDKKLK